jgi:hypothetical protein
LPRTRTTSNSCRRIGATSSGSSTAAEHGRDFAGAEALRLYVDTSALIKLIVVEDGSDVAAELWDSYPDHDRAVAELTALNAELVIVGVDESLALRAGEIADERALWL